jgi:hypothetical protein
VTLQPVEEQLLGLVDGQRTVGEVASAAYLGEFDATKVLFHLAEAGYLEATEQPQVSAADHGARMGALAHGYVELLRLVTVTVPSSGRPAFLSIVADHLGDPNVPFAPIFAGLELGEDGGLDPDALLGNMAALRPAPPQEELPRLLVQGLRELLFFYLFLAGDRLARDADETLGTNVRRKLTSLEGLSSR